MHEEVNNLSGSEFPHLELFSFMFTLSNQTSCFIGVSIADNTHNTKSKQHIQITQIIQFFYTWEFYLFSIKVRILHTSLIRFSISDNADNTKNKQYLQIMQIAQCFYTCGFICFCFGFIFNKCKDTIFLDITISIKIKQLLQMVCSSCSFHIAFPLWIMQIT